MRYLICLVLTASAFAGDRPCLILAAAPPPIGIATWSQAGRQARHALVYLAADYPAGVAFCSQVKDKDVDKIKAKGAQVIILDAQYTRADLRRRLNASRRFIDIQSGDFLLANPSLHCIFFESPAGSPRSNHGIAGVLWQRLARPLHFGRRAVTTRCSQAS